MNKLSTFLKQLDLSDVEVTLYNALLDNGPISVRDLAMLTNMKRTTAYFYIDQLSEKGLIVRLTRGTQKLVALSQPKESITTLVEQKSSQAKEIKTQLPGILKKIALNLPQTQTKFDADVKHFKGIINARKIYKEALAGDELHSYIRIDKTDPLFPNNASVFSDAFEKNPKLKVWEIVYDREDSAGPSKESRSRKGRYFYKYMPKSQKLSSEDILIYDGKVAIINYRGGKTSIVLESQDLHNNFKDIFTFLWNVLPEPTEK